MSTATEPTKPGLLTRINRLPGWQFTLTLYLLRWAIVIPLGYLLNPTSSATDRAQLQNVDLTNFFLTGVLLDPLVETVVECSLVYIVLHSILRVSTQRVLPFVFCSAMAMVLLHPLTPIVFTFAFITGLFLAYVYAHFAPINHIRAIKHTAAFHAGINLVGWAMMWLQK
ncbi:MAG TPA: hypothetical protein VH107_11960 [Lacipirellulaceae bacterium]|jgi:hypothetical protein|nr:hypothetical protein [Lacipirellulaceae bacterium]